LRLERVIENTGRLLLPGRVFRLEPGVLFGHLPGDALADSGLVGPFRFLQRECVFRPAETLRLDADGRYQDDDRDSKPGAPIEEQGDQRRHNSRSALRRFVKPRHTTPPALLNRRKASHAALTFPLRSSRATVERQKPPCPML
jgi:hypothetical protein